MDSSNLGGAESVRAGESREGFPRTPKDGQDLEGFEGRTVLGRG